MLDIRLEKDIKMQIEKGKSSKQIIVFSWTFKTARRPNTV
jgi:hypothetical protein